MFTLEALNKSDSFICDREATYDEDKRVAEVVIRGREYYISRPDAILAYKIATILERVVGLPLIDDIFDRDRNDFEILQRALAEIYTEEELLQTASQIIKECERRRIERLRANRAILDFCVYKTSDMVNMVLADEIVFLEVRGFLEKLKQRGLILEPIVSEETESSSPMENVMGGSDNEAVRFDALIQDFKRTAIAVCLCQRFILPLMMGRAKTTIEFKLELAVKLWGELDKRHDMLMGELEGAYRNSGRYLISAKLKNQGIGSFFMWEKQICDKEIFIPLAVAEISGDLTWPNKFYSLFGQIKIDEKGSYDPEEFIDKTNIFVLELNRQGFFEQAKESAIWDKVVESCDALVQSFKPCVWEVANRVPAILTLDDGVLKKYQHVSSLMVAKLGGNFVAKYFVRRIGNYVFVFIFYGGVLNSVSPFLGP